METIMLFQRNIVRSPKLKNNCLLSHMRQRKIKHLNFKKNKAFNPLNELSVILYFYKKNEL